LRAAGGTCRYVEGGNGLMGVEDSVYETFEERIGPCTTIVLYTDGLIERRGESLDAGLERLAGAACFGPEEPELLCEHIVAQLLEPGSERYDDVTAVVARLTASGDGA
jgi:serine phosphatase RsbU (regulator of sigma subunit)